MSVAQTVRTWAVDESWSSKQLDDFGALMALATTKRRGSPALVTAWSRSRGRICWHCANCGPDEVALRDRCREIFGTKERAFDPVTEQQQRKLPPKVDAPPGWRPGV